MKKYQRRLCAALIALVTLMTLCTTSLASRQQDATLYYNDIKITLDGEPIVPTDAAGKAVEPFIIDGTTYLPVRGIASALGLEVEWDGATSTVILKTPEAKRPIYITRTGKKYHYDSTCNGGTYWEVPYETAIGFGLEPCDKCVLKGN